MADQRGPDDGSGSGNSESIVSDPASRKMTQAQIRQLSLRWMPQEVRDAFTRQFNLSLKVSRHLGTMNKLKFDRNTFDLQWNGKENDLVQLTNIGILKRLREEVTNEHGAKKPKVTVETSDNLPTMNHPTDEEVEDEPEEGARYLDKDFTDDVLKKIRALDLRAWEWDKLELYLRDAESPKWCIVKEYLDALQKNVLSHVTKLLIPQSADKPYTGSFDSFLQVMLLVTGRITSEEFKSGIGNRQEVLLGSEDDSQDALVFFKMIGVLSMGDIAPEDIEMATKPWVRKLIKLESITKQRDLYHMIDYHFYESRFEN